MEEKKKKSKKKKLLIAGVATPVLIAVFSAVTIILLPKILWDKAWGAIMDAIEAIVDTGKGVAQWIGDPNQPERERLALMRFKDADGFDDLYSFDFLFALDQDDDKDNPYLTLKKKVAPVFSKMYLSDSDMVTLLSNLYDPTRARSDEDYVSTHFLYKPQIELKLTAEEFATIYEQAFEVLAHSPITDELISDYRAYKAPGSKMTEAQLRTTVIIRDTNTDGRFSGEDTIRYMNEDLKTLRTSGDYSSFGYVPERVDEKGNPINQQYELRLQLLEVCDWTTELRNPADGSIDLDKLQLLASWWWHFGVIFHYSPVASYINGKLEEKAKTNKGDKTDISYIGEEPLIDKQSRSFSIILEPYGDYADANISFIYELDRVRYPGMNEKYMPEYNPILFQEGTKTGTYTVDAFLMENGKVKTFSTVSYEDETRKFGVDWQMMYAALVLYGRDKDIPTDEKAELERQIKALQENEGETDKGDSGTLKLDKSFIRSMAKTFKNMESIEENDATSIEAINDYLKENELYTYVDINQKSLAHQGWVKWNAVAELTHEERTDVLFEGVTSHAYVPTYIPRTYSSALCDVTYASYEGGRTIESYKITYHWDTFADTLKDKFKIDLDSEKNWKSYTEILSDLPGGDRIIAKLEHVKENSGKTIDEAMAYQVKFGNYEHAGHTYATAEMTINAEDALPHPTENGGSTCNDVKKDGNISDFRARTLTEDEIELILAKIHEQYPGIFPSSSDKEVTIGYTMIKTALNSVGKITYRQGGNRNGANKNLIGPFSNGNAKLYSSLITKEEVGKYKGAYADIPLSFYDNQGDHIVATAGLFQAIYQREGWPLGMLFPQSNQNSLSMYSYNENGEWVKAPVRYPYTADCSSFVDILYTAALISATGNSSYVNAFDANPLPMEGEHYSISDFKTTDELHTIVTDKWTTTLNDGTDVSISYLVDPIFRDVSKLVNGVAADDTDLSNLRANTDLLPGDLILSSDASNKNKGHVVIFLGWTCYQYEQGMTWLPLVAELRGTKEGTSAIGVNNDYTYGACAISVLSRDKIRGNEGVKDGEKKYYWRARLQVVDPYSRLPLYPLLQLNTTALHDSEFLIKRLEQGEIPY